MRATNILLLLLVMTGTQTIFAGTYFIEPDGDDSYPGTVWLPLATFAEAASRVAPGDTVLVRDGAYHERVVLTTSGTAAQPIVWMVFPQEAVTINGISRSLNGFDPASEGPQWEFVDCDWQEVYDFKIVNSPSYGISDLNGSSKHLKFERVKVLDCHESGFYLVGNRNKIFNCESGYNFDYAGNENLYDSLNVSGSRADGFTIDGHTNLLFHCIAYANSDNGFDLKESHDNRIAECTSYRNGSTNGARDRDHSLYAGLTFAGNGSGYLVGPGEDFQAFNTVIKSLAFQNPGIGFDQNGGGGVEFLNNTAYSNAPNFASWDHVDNLGILTTTYTNNISHEGTLEINGTFVEEHNSWDATITVIVTDADFVNLDPNSGNFMKLVIGSDCLDVGVDIGQPFVGTAPDLGYKERGEDDDDTTGTGTAISIVPFASAAWNLYPIPASENIFIDLSEMDLQLFDQVQLSIFDLNGRMVTALKPESIVEEVSLQDLSAGTYMVRLSTGNASETKLIIVE